MLITMWVEVYGFFIITHRIQLTQSSYILMHLIKQFVAAQQRQPLLRFSTQCVDALNPKKRRRLLFQLLFAALFYSH